MKITYKELVLSQGAISQFFNTPFKGVRMILEASDAVEELNKAYKKIDDLKDRVKKAIKDKNEEEKQKILEESKILDEKTIEIHLSNVMYRDVFLNEYGSNGVSGAMIADCCRIGLLKKRD